MLRRCCPFLLLLASASCNESTKSNSSNEAGPATIGATQATFRSFKSDSVFHTNKPVHCIFQDKAGSFWFGTEGDGLCRYDGTRFTWFTVNEGLCSDFVWTIDEDKNGKLWLSTRDGICRYDDTAFTWFADDGILRNRGYALSPKIDTGKVWQRTPGDLWFSANSGVYRYDGNAFTFLPLPRRESDNSPRSADRLNPYTVYCTYTDKAGNVWCGTQSIGVCRYDGKSFAWFDEEGLSGPAVRAVFQDSKGNMWFGNNGAGVFRYDGKALTNFTAAHNVSNERFLRTHFVMDTPGTLARIWSIAEDDAGSIWFATIDAGAWRYDPSSQVLTNFTTKDGLASNVVNSIYKDKSGGLWFGTNSGACRFDGTRFTTFTGTDSIRL